MYHKYEEVMIYSDVTFFEKREGPRLIQQNGWSCPFKVVAISMYGCRDRIAFFIGQKETGDGGSRELVVLWVKKSGRFVEGRGQKT